MAGKSRTLNFVLAADAKQVTRAFNQVEKGGDRLAKHTEDTHGRMQRSYAGSAKSALKWGAATAGAYLTISKAHDAISSTEELAKATQGLHRNLGLSVQEASRWGAVAKARGIDNKAMTMSFTTLSRQVEAANAGGAKQQKIFQALGLSQKDVKNGTKDFSGLVTQLADGFGKLHGGTQRQAAAQQLLGRGYQSILPLFAEGSKSLKEQLHWADQYGVTLNSKTIGPINELVKSQRELKVGSLGLQVAFTKAVTPALLEMEHATERVLKVMNDPKLTDSQKWEKIGNIVGPIANKIGDGVTAAIPKIAEAVGHHAPEVASAFAKGFVNADAMGKLAIGGWLIHKFGGFGAFSSLGRSAGGQVGGSMGTAAAQGFKARFKSTLGTVAKGLGIASILSGVATAATTKGGAGDKAQGFVSGATFGIVPPAAESRLKGTVGLVRQMNEQLRGFASAGNSAAFKQTARGLDQLAHTKIGHDWFDKGQLEAARNQMNHTGDRIIAMKDTFDRMRKGSVTDMKTLRSSVASNFATIAQVMGAKSKNGARAVSNNTDLAVKNIKQFMADGVLTTRQGMNEIQKVFRAEMRLYGISGNQANADANTRAFNLQHANQNGTSRGQVGSTGRAGGGLVGRWGEKGPDAVHAILGRGEFVLNNTGQQLVAQGVTDLRVVEREQAKVPHYMATGGRVPRQVVTGPAGAERSILQGSLDKDRSAANRVLAKLMAASGSAPGASGPQPKGVGMFDGKPVAKWIIPWLKYGRSHGWQGGVNSGWRSFAEQTRIWNSGVRPAARPGTSNHEGSAYPRGAVDVSDAAQLAGILQHAHSPLVWAGAKDPVHFSHPHGGSYKLGGFVKRFSRGGIAGLDHVFGRNAHLSPGQVNSLARAVGFDTAGAKHMTEIAHGESSYMPGVVSSDGGYGLWQMTPRVWGSAAKAKMNSLGGVGQMLNPVKNALMARYLFSQSGYGPWFGTRYLTGRNGGLSGAPSISGGGASGGGGSGPGVGNTTPIAPYGGGGGSYSGPHGGGGTGYEPTSGPTFPSSSFGGTSRLPSRHGIVTPGRGGGKPTPASAGMAGIGSDGYEPVTAQDYIDAAIAQASLTSDTADDIAAATSQVTFDKLGLANALKSNDPRQITQWANALKGAQDSLDSLTAAVTDDKAALASAMADLATELKRQNDQRDQIQAVGERTALDMLSGVLSGRIGAKVTQRQAARTFGTVARA